MTSVPVVKSQRVLNNPHHLIVEQKAVNITREISSLLRETVNLGKSGDALKNAQKQFAQCDKIFVSSESKLASIGRNLKLIEKADNQIVNSLSTVPTIQGKLGLKSDLLVPLAITYACFSQFGGG